MNWDLFFAFILGFTMGAFIGIYISYKAASLTEPRRKRKKQNVVAIAPCGDAISRKDTCTAIIKRLGIKDETFLLQAERVIYQQILAMPSVTPQPKTGEWIKSRDCYDTNHFTCPFCGHDIATKYNGTWEDNYCSNCGAKLESGEGV